MKFSIVLPYLSKSPCIDLCKELLQKNTVNEYELIEIVDNTDVYAAYNDGAFNAKNDIILLLNDDMFVSPGWDELYIKYCEPKTVVTGYLIESGRIPVASQNISYNCGTTLETFDYQKFIDFSLTLNNPEVRNDLGWYMPVAFHKSTFINYPNDIKYPHPNDITLIKDLLPQMGYRYLQVASYVYHLQNYTSTYK